MSETFRSKVEEILSFRSCEYDGRICSDMTLDKYEERPSCEQCRTDRICAAYKEAVEGMPLKEQKLTSKVFISEYQKGIHWGG